MRPANNKLRQLAELAWALSNFDVVVAVKILREWTGLSEEMAFSKIDEVGAFDDAPPAE